VWLVRKQGGSYRGNAAFILESPSVDIVQVLDDELEYTSYPAMSEEQPVLGTEEGDIEVDVVGVNPWCCGTNASSRFWRSPVVPGVLGSLQVLRLQLPFL